MLKVRAARENPSGDPPPFDIWRSDLPRLSLFSLLASKSGETNKHNRESAVDTNSDNSKTNATRRFVLGVPPRLDPDGAEMLRFVGDSFDALELPEPLFASPGFDKTLNVSNLTDIVPKSVSRGIFKQSRPIKDEFIALFIKAFDKTGGMSLNSGSLDLGLDDASPKSPDGELKTAFLKSLAAHLYRNNLTTRLPTRLPRHDEPPTSPIPAFIQASMCGLYRAEVNVHPHELLEAEPFELLRPFRFLAESVSFVYEPEAGNFLVEKLLAPWFEALDELSFEGDIVFKPLVSTWENLDDAVDALHPLLTGNKIFNIE